jgi:hypothetical protein
MVPVDRRNRYTCLRSTSVCYRILPYDAIKSDSIISSISWRHHRTMPVVGDGGRRIQPWRPQNYLGSAARLVTQALRPIPRVPPISASPLVVSALIPIQPPRPNVNHNKHRSRRTLFVSRRPVVARAQLIISPHSTSNPAPHPFCSTTLSPLVVIRHHVGQVRGDD